MEQLREMIFIIIMKINMNKKILIGLLIGLLGLLVLGVWVYKTNEHPMDELVGGSELWKFTSSLLQPVVSTWDVSAPSNLRFDGEIKPDGSTCSNDQILKKTGANDWDCASDSTGSVACNSLNFDEFQNPLVLDLGITTTSATFNWNLGAISLVNIGSASFSKYINVGGVAGVRIDGDGDG